LLAGLGLITGSPRFTRFSGSGLDGLRLLFLTLVPLAGLTLGQVLVASEFRQRTQLFLEGLPLPRWRFIALKYLLGLGVMIGAGAVMLAVISWRVWEREALNLDFVQVLALKGAAWIFFVHALFFTHSFLGRYRWGAAALVILIVLNLSVLGLAVDQFPPLRLIDSRFAFDRYESPLPDVLWTLGIGSVLAAVGFALGLMRDASVASLLAERMSSREKGFVTVIALLAVLGSVTVLEKRAKISPVHLPGAFSTLREHVRVTVAAAADRPSAAEVKAMEGLGPRLADDLDALSDYLGIPQLPPIFVVYRRDFAADRFENGGLKHRQGLLVRANPLAEGFREDKLQRWLVKELLLLRSEGRLGLERNAWVLDGLPRWWQSRGSAPRPDAISRELASEALANAGPSATLLRRWYSVRKAAGGEQAEHLAASGLQIMEASAGEAKMRLFLSAMLRRAATKDVRTWFREMLHPWPRILRRETGIDSSALVTRWQVELRKQCVAAVKP
jgi:hypothetical protein